MVKEFLKSDFFLNYISYFLNFLPFKFLYQVFKESYRICNYSVSQKAYNHLKSRTNLNDKQIKKLFISLLVIYEENLNQKKNLIQISSNHLTEIKKFRNNIYHFKKKRSLNYFKNFNFEEIIKEFLYLDIKSTRMEIYFKAQYIKSSLNNFENPQHIKLNYWWFCAIGHYQYLDALIKAIQMKIINVKKIYLNIDKNLIANKYLYNFYKKLLQKNNLLTNKKKGLELNMRYWFLNKPKKSFESEQLHEYIQSEWYKNKSCFTNNTEKKNFETLKKKLGITRPIVTIHIRQKGFNPDVDMNNFRNSEPKIIYKILDKYKTKFNFVILGGKNSLKIPPSDYIFDYPHSNFKNEKNDILLIKFSAGHIGTTSGITHYYLTTDIPVLFVNWHPFEFFLKNKYSVILPKIIRSKKNNRILSLNDFYKIKPNFMYSGYQRLNNLGYECLDNSYDDLSIAIKNYLHSLAKKKWSNYGKYYKIKKINYHQHSIPADLPKKILKIREGLFFDPNFVKKYNFF